MSEICLINMANNHNLKINKKEVFRYLNVAKIDSMTDSLVDECIKEIYEIITPRAVYVKSSIEIEGEDTVKFDFMSVKSRNLVTNLKSCKNAYIFGATLGITLDREIEKYSKYAPSRSAIYHAVGSAFIEAFCDYVNDTLASKEDSMPRFSPGYGDLLLDCQREILAALDAERKIGIMLGESLLMSPSKSVTAIIGLK